MWTPRTLVAILAIALAASAQQPPQEEEQPVFRGGVTTVIAPTIVLDRDGIFVSGLQRQDFRLLDNDKPQDIRVDVSYIPISLVVAIQNNTAVEAVLPKIKKLGSLLQPLVVGDQGEVAILSFDHRVTLRQEFTSDTEKIQKAINGINIGGSSNRLIDATLEGIRLLRKRPESRRRVLLLVGETRDRGSEARGREVLYDAQFANVAVYSLNINRLITTLTAKAEPPRPDPIPYTARPLPAGVPQTPHTAAQVSGNAGNSANFIPAFIEIFKATKAIFIDNPMEKFTKWTGGTEHPFISQSDMEHAVNRIGEELHAQYMISYTPNNKLEGGFHEIKVEVSRPGVKALTRPGYWIAAQPQ